MPKSKTRKNRGPGKQFPELDDLLRGAASVVIRDVRFAKRCPHCGQPATALLTVRARGRSWPVPLCAQETNRFRRAAAHLPNLTIDEPT